MNEKLTAIQAGAAMRRSQYDLGKDLPITAQELKHLVEEIVLHSPSARNSQTARLVLVLGEQHERMWDTVLPIILPGVKEPLREAMVQKFEGFKRAAGTLLFFEDGAILKDIIARYPHTAEDTLLFSAHANAMQQYAAWTQLAALHIGASLQHHNSAGQAIREMFSLPEDWIPHAQLVFGSIVKPTGKVKEQHLPVNERLRVIGKI